MVPHHIRVVIHKVRMKVHDRALKWPTILILGENIILTAPVMVDHLGGIRCGAEREQGGTGYSHK